MTKYFNFSGWTVYISMSKYARGGSPALMLMDAHDGTPVATATVNLPDYPLPEGCVFIRDSEENQGMLEFLTSKNIAEDTGVEVPSGWISCPMVRLLPEEMWIADTDERSIKDSIQEGEWPGDDVFGATDQDDLPL